MKCWKLPIQAQGWYLERTPVHSGPMLVLCLAGITMQKNSISKQTNALYHWQCTASHKTIKGQSSLLCNRSSKNTELKMIGENTAGSAQNIQSDSFYFEHFVSWAQKGSYQDSHHFECHSLQVVAQTPLLEAAVQAFLRVPRRQLEHKAPRVWSTARQGSFSIYKMYNSSLTKSRTDRRRLRGVRLSLMQNQKGCDSEDRHRHVPCLNVCPLMGAI